MKILSFNPTTGLYHFELTGIATEFHAHPATEFLHAPSGNLLIETTNARYENVAFAAIPANVKHRVTAPAGAIELLLLEGRVKESTVLGIEIITKEIYREKGYEKRVTTIPEIIERWLSGGTQKQYDQSVKSAPSSRQTSAASSKNSPQK